MWGEAMKRWVYTEGGQPLPEPIEVSEDWTNAEQRAPHLTEGVVYGNDVAQDGTNISTRRRRQEYMERNGLADVGDFTNHWARMKKEREEYHSSGKNLKRVTQSVVDAYNKLRKP